MSEAIDCVELSKSYRGQKQALSNFSAQFKYGAIYGLIGPNGAGKSTLIHLLGGVLQPTSGQLKKWVKSSSDIAWVSQRTAVDWYLNVADNVRLGARLGGLQGKQATSMVAKSLEVVGLAEKGGCRLDALSGGEQQRTQIARALAQNSRILLLDEPTTGLDPGAAYVLMSELKRLAQAGCCILVSSHDLGLVDQFADEVVVLSEGKRQENFVPTQSVKLHYAGEIPDATHRVLKEAGIRCSNTNPIEISTLDLLSRALQALLEVVEITHIESTHSLNGIFHDALLRTRPGI